MGGGGIFRAQQFGEDPGAADSGEPEFEAFGVGRLEFRRFEFQLRIDGVEFSYDEYGNYRAVYTSPDGYDAYQALVVTDDFAASLMFTVPEGEMDNYDAGYILSLVELA